MMYSDFPLLSEILFALNQCDKSLRSILICFANCLGELLILRIFVSKLDAAKVPI